VSRMRSARAYDGETRKRTVTVTPAGYAQRMANVKAIAERARAKETCIRGHSNWKIRANGRRQCITCLADYGWYRYRGLPYV